MSGSSKNALTLGIPADSPFARFCLRIGPARRVAVALFVIDIAVILLVGLVLRLLARDWAPTTIAFWALVALTVLVVVVVATSRLWAFTGVNGPSRWRDRRLLVLPTLMVIAPVVTGIKPLSLDYLLFLVCAYALTGFTEELIWRGLIIGVLRPTGIWPAVLFGSLLFGLAHLPNVFFRESAILVVFQAIGAFCFGVGFAALRLRTGTLVPLMVIHALHDLCAQIGALPAIPLLVAQDTILLLYGIYLLRPSKVAELRATDDAVDASPTKSTVRGD